MDVSEHRTAQFSQVKDDLAEKVQKLFKAFLNEFVEDESNDGEIKSSTEIQPKYHEEALSMISPDKNTLFVDFNDLKKYDRNLAHDIETDLYRFHPYLCRAVVSFLKDKRHDHEALIDIQPKDWKNIMKKEYFVGFYGVSERIKLRDLRATKCAQLVQITGQVIRANSVHPELIAGTFECMSCLTEIPNVEQQFKYTEPTICQNPMCSNRTKYRLLLHKSRFVDFQKLRIQELQSDVPQGFTPRSIDVIIRGGDRVECIQPGDRASFIGCLISVPDVAQLTAGSVGLVKTDSGATGDGIRGLKALGVREMTHKLAFLVSSIVLDGAKLPIQLEERNKPKCEKNGLIERYTLEDNNRLKMEEMARDRNLFDNLCKSIFPSIYGNEDIKKGIVLQMFGGVRKLTNESINLRGDINICIVGDPGTAKSRFLKIVADFSPSRAVYTSGKASTAAGLTAAVVKDADGDFVIEAGALLLADQGICCIDEFDKMGVRDQVAIHEAMEQQTISITKAGVKAILNARASILAAANPIDGTYDRTKSLRRNLSLSLPIMSRFDLFFVLLDESNEAVDYALAEKIINMHRDPESCATDTPYTLDEVRMYIQYARQFMPKLTLESEKHFVESYKQLRLNGCTDSATGVFKNSNQARRITVRQLESLIRLSEAIARMYCSENVEANHIKEAYRLLNKSIVKIDQPDVNLIDDEPIVPKDGSQQTDSQQSTGPIKRKDSLKISYDTYLSITNMLVIKLKREEDKMESGESEGIRRSQLVDWYLEQIVGEIESEQELLQKKLICEKIIEKLIQVDHILIELKDPSQEQDTEDNILVVHPDHIVDDI